MDPRFHVSNTTKQQKGVFIVFIVHLLTQQQVKIFLFPFPFFPPFTAFMCSGNVPAKCQEHKACNIRTPTWCAVTFMVKKSSPQLYKYWSRQWKEFGWGCTTHLKWIPLCQNISSFFLFLSGVSPFTVSPGDARLAELQRYVQRETDALVVANDVAKQLEGIASLDHKAAAEVELDRAPFHSSSRPTALILVSLIRKWQKTLVYPCLVSIFKLPEEK